MFTTLVAVDLSYNCLRVNILFFSPLSKLLFCFSSLKTVPKELFQCTKLEHLYLRHNPITSISSGMNNLKTLIFLDIAFCQLYGSLPDR
jgi:Leucine-rich repeat (LRR) protein